MDHEYSIGYVEPKCAYFKCNICGDLISLEYPESYKEAADQYNELVKKHKHPLL